MPKPLTTNGCRQLVLAVEDLRKRRRCALRQSDQDSVVNPHKFTVGELTKEAWGSYRKALQNRIKHSPPREVVLAIADYLKATTLERNTMLWISGYRPDFEQLDHEQVCSVIAQVISAASKYLNC